MIHNLTAGKSHQVEHPAAAASRKGDADATHSSFGSALQNLFHSHPETVAGSAADSRPDAPRPAAASTPITASPAQSTTGNAAAHGASAPPAIWETSVTGTSPNGTQSTYNTRQFATSEMAALLAREMGGNVTENQYSGGFATTSPERLITGLGANALNAGLVADLFAKYGDKPGSEAWKVIQRDLGHYASEADTPPVMLQILKGQKT